jgi:hypothetical protein
MTTVVHVKLKPFDVYIGRKHKDYPEGSKWGNPFIRGRDGALPEILAKYREYILAEPNLLASLPEIDGKILGCWCRVATDPDRPCHGDVLVSILREFSI